jgi:hypothetical protein
MDFVSAGCQGLGFRRLARLDHLPQRMLSLIVAGLLSLPFFGWCLIVVPVLGALVLLPLCFLVYPSNNNKTTNKTLCNVIITGGSSGIGLAIAKECCLLPNVKCITLIARNQQKLEAAKQELLMKATREECRCRYSSHFRRRDQLHCFGASL